MNREPKAQSWRNIIVGHFLAATAVVLLSSCAATSVNHTWKAPGYTGGPVARVAVLTVEDRGLVRRALEIRFANQLNGDGQSAFVTHELLSLPSIKENKEAAAARLKEKGADSILIVRLVDTKTYAREIHASDATFVPVTIGFENYGWYDYYSLAFVDMGTVWNSLKQTVYLDTSLYELNTGKRIWSCLTETVLKENMDKLEVADTLVAKVVSAARSNGMIH